MSTSRSVRIVALAGLGVAVIAGTAFTVTRSNDDGEAVSTYAGSRRGFADGRASSAQFHYPGGLEVGRDGTVFVVDADNDRIRRISTDGNVSTFAGSGTRGYRDGSPTVAQFAFASDLTIGPDGSLFVTDQNNSRIRRIDAAGNVTTVAPNFEFDTPTGVVIRPSDGHLIVADAGTHALYSIDLATNTVTVLAGIPGKPGRTDAADPLAAQFNAPFRIDYGRAGELYIADASNHLIRRMDATGAVTTFAGTGEPGYRDGALATAAFNNVVGLAVDARGNLWIPDFRNHSIRWIDVNGKTVCTVTGSGKPGFRNGPLELAVFQFPHSISVGPDGAVFVTADGTEESRGHLVRRIVAPDPPCTAPST
jgi:DNA-binding beta-propeller fold protein YncE